MFKTIIDKFSKKSLFAGLDLGAANIKSLQLSATKQGYRVENYLIEPCTADPNIAIATVLNKLAPQSINIAIADTHIINKIITLPSALNADQIYDLLHTEAEQYFTQSLDALYFDFQILGINSNDSLTVDILLIVAHKNYIDNQVNSVQSLGYPVKIVDVQSHAIERAFNFVTTDPVHLVVDVGLHSLLVLVIENKNIIFTHSEMIAIFSPQEAVLAISRALKMFSVNNPKINIYQLFVIGGTAHLPDFIELLSVHLKMQINIANPFLNMELNPSLVAEHLYEHAADLVLSLGLALRNFQNIRAYAKPNHFERLDSKER